MNIWDFNKEEIISRYRVLEKIAWEWIDKKITAQIDVGLMEEYQQRGEYIKSHETYISSEKIKMITSTLNPQTGE